MLSCFEEAREKNYDIFALTLIGNRIQCLSGRDAKKNLKTYPKGSESDCNNGRGGRDSFDIYLVPGRAISGEYFPKSGI